MADQVYQLTRTSSAPLDLRMTITATGEQFSLAPGETVLVGTHVAALVAGDVSLQAHFSCMPVTTTGTAQADGRGHEAT